MTFEANTITIEDRKCFVWLNSRRKNLRVLGGHQGGLHPVFKVFKAEPIGAAGSQLRKDAPALLREYLPNHQVPAVMARTLWAYRMLSAALALRSCPTADTQTPGQIREGNTRAHAHMTRTHWKAWFPTKRYVKQFSEQLVMQPQHYPSNNGFKCSIIIFKSWWFLPLTTL